ncbi:MAG TPA: EF-hand domain-containing protein [Polyangiales bacterium]
MTTQNKWLLVSLISTLAGVGAAAAQPGGGKHFEQLDTNGDGVVTTAEFEAGALSRWTQADANKDGKVTADEFKAAREAHEHGSCGPKHLAKMEGRGLPGDENRDGVVTKAEAVAGAQKWAKKIDANGDGTLTKEEFMSARPHHGHGPHHPHGPQHAPSAG